MNIMETTAITLPRSRSGIIDLMSVFDAAISCMTKKPAGTSSNADSHSDLEHENASQADAETDRRNPRPTAEATDMACGA